MTRKCQFLDPFLAKPENVVNPSFLVKSPTLSQYIQWDGKIHTPLKTQGVPSCIFKRMSKLEIYDISVHEISEILIKKVVNKATFRPLLVKNGDFAPLPDHPFSSQPLPWQAWLRCTGPGYRNPPKSGKFRDFRDFRAGGTGLSVKNRLR